MSSPTTRGQPQPAGSKTVSRTLLIIAIIFMILFAVIAAILWFELQQCNAYKLNNVCPVVNANPNAP